MKFNRRFFLEKMWLVSKITLSTDFLVTAHAANVSQSLDENSKVMDFSKNSDKPFDDTIYAQKLLDSCEAVVDFHGIPRKIMLSLRIPHGLEVRNVNLIAGVPGMKMLLVESNTKISGVLTGSENNEGLNEWGVYPASAGVNDVQLHLAISKVSVGVQIWNCGSGSVPQRWSGSLCFSDLKGGGRKSNGYGLLLAGAQNCEFDVTSKRTPRHCIYLSNGARGNKITLRSWECGGAPVQLGAYDSQDYVENNVIVANISSMKPSSSASPYAVNLVGKVKNNIISVFVDSSPFALGAILFRALNSNSVPHYNIATIYHVGGYSGAGVVQSDSAFENVVNVTGDGGSSAKKGGAIISVNNYNGIIKPNGNYKNSLIVRKFSWDPHMQDAKGIAIFVTYAPVSISLDAEKGLKNFGSRMFAAGSSQVNVIDNNDF